MSLISQIKARIRGEKTISDLEKLGFSHGRNLHVQQDCIIDPGHCMLISVGDDVTLAPRVHILAHDASTKIPLGYTKIAPVAVGNRVFIGAGTVVLPGVCIGDDVIVGAGSVVTKSLASGYVYAGNPARPLMSMAEYTSKETERMEKLPVFDSRYRIDCAGVKLLEELREAVCNAGGGFIE